MNAITDAQVKAAAKVLSMLHATACGVDIEDTWRLYAEDFMRGARLALLAAMNANDSEEKPRRGSGFDLAGFYAALDRARVSRGETWRGISKATGVSATTLSRMSSGRRPDAASLSALSAWAGINPSNYAAKRRPRTPAPPAGDEQEGST